MCDGGASATSARAVNDGSGDGLGMAEWLTASNGPLGFLDGGHTTLPNRICILGRRSGWLSRNANGGSVCRFGGRRISDFLGNGEPGIAARSRRILGRHTARPGRPGGFADSCPQSSTGAGFARDSLPPTACFDPEPRKVGQEQAQRNKQHQHNTKTPSSKLAGFASGGIGCRVHARLAATADPTPPPAATGCRG